MFIVKDADELSHSAANSLLKTLEEPHALTYFVLLTSRGKRLLDTIRSRTQLVRFGPLRARLVQRILEERGIDPEIAYEAAELAGGSFANALFLADPESVRERTAFVDAVLAAVRRDELASALTVAEGRPRDKAVLADRLGALCLAYRKLGCDAATESPSAANRAALSYDVVVRALAELERNASPALLLESMIVHLSHIA